MIHKVTVRSQIISGNRLSVFLDYYPPVKHPDTGKPTRREFLNLFEYSDISITESKYIDNKGIRRVRFEFACVEKRDASGRVTIKPKARKLTEAEKQHNAYVKILAEQIRQRRENEINKPEIYSEFEREQIRMKELGNKSFVIYFEKLADQRVDKNRLIWMTAVEYFKLYAENKDVQFKDLTLQFCDGFRNFLLTTNSRKSKNKKLARNSAQSYYNKFRAALKRGFKDSYFQTDLNGRLDPIEGEETLRINLTLEELNQLVLTACSNEVMKKAALFSSLTGLRFSDLQALTWGNIEHTIQGYTLSFRIKKTREIEILPISDQAYSLLGERRDPEDKVFAGLVYSSTENGIMAKWGKDAKILKKLTYHVFRHSFASLQLNYGTQMRLIQVALGHKNMSTTEIYAKVGNPQLREAMDKIKLNL